MSAPSPPVISNTIPRGTPNLLEFWWDPPVSGTVTQYRLQCSALSIDQYYDVSAERYAYFSVPSNNVFYQFQITALNGAAESDPAYYPPWEAGFPSGAPTSIGGQFITPSTISMNWTAPVTPNTIQYYLTQGVPLNQSNSTDVLQNVQYAGTTSAVLPEFNADRAYNFNVRAFSTPGWSDPSDSLTYGRLYGCFITNAFTASTLAGVDSNGNQVVVCAARTSGTPVRLYNRLGNLVQEFSGAETSGSGQTFRCIVYISADGYSNVWAAKIICGFSSTVATSSTGTQINIQFDSNNNIIIPINISNSVTVYDKTGAIVTSFTSPGIAANVYGYVIKFSPTGIWNGVNDPTTWVSRVLISGASSSALHSTRITGIVLDSNDNIIINCSAQNVLATPQTITVSDQTQTTIGTPITISGNLSTLNTVYVKYASSGLVTNSWRAYVSSVNSQQIMNQQLAVNKYGQVIAAATYREISALYGSDDTLIGSVLPFTSSLATTSSYTQSVLIRFCSTGAAATSWRAPMYASSLFTLSKQTVPRSVLIDSNDNIYCTGFSELGTRGNDTVPLFVCASNDTTFISTVTLGFNNVYTAKYTNTGEPQWVTLLKGTNIVGSGVNAATHNTFFAPGPSGNNTTNTPQYLTTTFDNDQNVCLVGPYYRGNFEVINRNNLVTYTAPISGASTNSTFVATYAVKLTNEGSNAFVGIVNTISSTTSLITGFIYPTKIAFDSSNSMVLLENIYNPLAGTTTISSVGIGIYGNENTSIPTLSTINITGDPYGCVVKFTSSMSTINIASLYQRRNNSTTSSAVYNNYLGIDSNDDVIVSGNFTNFLAIADFGNPISSFTRGFNIAGGTLNTYQGMYVAKLTGNPSNSWVSQVAASNTTGVNQTNLVFQQFVGFNINPTTNSIYTGGYVTSNIYTLYDGYNSTVKLMGFASTTMSNVTFFTSYPSDGRVTLS
jgi:hypothetical protein